MKKLNGGGGDGLPIVAYYQFAEPEEPNDKVRVLKKGDKIVGVYEHTFVQKVDSIEYRNHLIRTAEGKVTIKGSTGLNNTLANIEKMTPVLIEYMGKGKKKPGRKPPHLFDVYGLTDQELSELQGPAAKKTTPKPAPEEEQEAQEDEEDLVF